MNINFHITLALFVMFVTIINPRGMISLDIAFSLYYIFCHFAPKMGITSEAFILSTREKVYMFVMYTITLVISITSFWEKE